ncbi:MAG: NAD(P)-binding protein [Actinobacteria bacterium]|nr:NAD(P)-binding protein [Actinomycetota bacterium]
MDVRSRPVRVAAAATYDADLVGSGINTLTAAALLARAGWSVCVLERASRISSRRVRRPVSSSPTARQSPPRGAVGRELRRQLCEFAANWRSRPRGGLARTSSRRHPSESPKIARASSLIRETSAAALPCTSVESLVVAPRSRTRKSGIPVIFVQASSEPSLMTPGSAFTTALDVLPWSTAT